MLWIGLDDTDMEGTLGTGRHARNLAHWLLERYPVLGVTRHQLLFDARVPMTAKNSAAAVHIQLEQVVDLEALAEEIVARFQALFPEGSDPGLCLGQRVSAGIMAFGQRTKQTLVTQEEARALAAQGGLLLRGLGGTEGGVIGALAAVGLAASGNDGRFNFCGCARDLMGMQPVAAILASGIAEVRTEGGDVVPEGLVDTQDKLRPSLIGGRPVLLVERQDGHWLAIRRD